jgi:hypothetical protein
MKRPDIFRVSLIWMAILAAGLITGVVMLAM